MTIQVPGKKSSVAGMKLFVLFVIASSLCTPTSVSYAGAAVPSAPVKAETTGGAKTAGSHSETGSAKITITPASLNFGAVNVGSSRTVILVISNTGGSDLVIKSIDIDTKDPSQFQFMNQTCPSLNPTIKAGESCTIAVTFVPASEGAMAAKLVFSSNASSSPALDVPFNAIVSAAQAQKTAPAAAMPASPEAKPGAAKIEPVAPGQKPIAGETNPASQQQAKMTLELTADKASPVMAATVGSVTFTAHASGGSGKYEYRFWLKGPSTGNAWKVAQDYSASDAYPWIPEQEGSYAVWAYARDAAGTGAETSSWMPFDVVQKTPAASVELTVDKTSPAMRATVGTVTFTPHATGGSGRYEYQFWLQGPSTENEWKIAQNYGISDSFYWTPMQAGHYLVWVYAKNVGSPAAREAAAWTSFDIVDNTPARSVRLTADRTSPVPASTGGVRFTAKAAGGSGRYEYEFWLQGPSTGAPWKVVREYSASNVFSWTPDQAGAYSIAVYARNTGSPAGHDAVDGMTFDITGK